MKETGNKLGAAVREAAQAFWGRLHAKAEAAPCVAKTVPVPLSQPIEVKPSPTATGNELSEKLSPKSPESPTLPNPTPPVPFIVSGGERSVAIGSNTSGANTAIITGDNNQVKITHHSGGFIFHCIDEKFRERKAQCGQENTHTTTSANWSCIAREQDAPSDLLEALMAFIAQAQAGQCAAVITGLSGMGKTTLLMRLAWEASKAGYRVYWRHFGSVEASDTPAFTPDSCAILCIDDLPFEEGLLKLLKDLSVSGLPFVLLGTATRDWVQSESFLQAQEWLSWQEFPLERAHPSVGKASSLEQSPDVGDSENAGQRYVRKLPDEKQSALEKARTFFQDAAPPYPRQAPARLSQAAPEKDQKRGEQPIPRAKTPTAWPSKLVWTGKIGVC